MAPAGRGQPQNQHSGGKHDHAATISYDLGNFAIHASPVENLTAVLARCCMRRASASAKCRRRQNVVSAQDRNVTRRAK
jgi:hypothetical protein